MKTIIEQMSDFLAHEVTSRGFDKVVLGLSGGIDSALSSLVCSKVFVDNTYALIMPSSKSDPQNMQDAIDFATKYRIKYEIKDISKYEQIFISQNGEDPRRLGNFMARMRMILLYDYSALSHALVIGTSNKSELKLGYGTLYGDMASAINPLGDIYKSDIFKIFAYMIGECEIGQKILHKAPSADLYSGQSDEKDIGYSYENIDKVLKCIDKNMSEKDMIESSLDKDMIDSISARIKANAFKLEGTKILHLQGNR